VQPLRLHDDGSTVDMSVVDGPMLGVRGDVGGLPEAVDAVARLLADLHGSGVVVPRRRSAPRLVASLDRKFAGPRDPVVLLLDAIAPTLDEHLVVCHGDVTPRNIVLTHQGPALIDFDRLQMAGAGRDVQSLAAWVWATEVTAGRCGRDEGWHLGRHFEERYTACRPEAADELDRSRAFHRTAALVRIATSWSSMAADPTARRMVMAEAHRLARSCHAADRRRRSQRCDTDQS
jgi:Ser/Thr protein kinase RdoA (MazF antagonist)